MKLPHLILYFNFSNKSNGSVKKNNSVKLCLEETPPACSAPVYLMFFPLCMSQYLKRLCEGS